MKFMHPNIDFKAIWTLIKSSIQSWSDDYAASMGAALAYYTVFSIAPLLLIVISIAGLVFGEDAARGQLYGQLQGMLGSEGAQAVQAAVEAVNKPAQSVIATIIGVGVLLLGATTVFGELQDSLDRIWRAPAREAGGLWKLIRARVLSFGMILCIGFLLIVSLVTSAMISALGNWWSPLFGAWEILANIVNAIVSFVFTTCLFAMIYKLMPRVHIQWADVWVGSAVTSLLFTVGKFIIGLYIGKSSVASGFGAAGSLAVVLVWVYYSAQIFLVGAEFTWVYAHTFGSRRGLERPQALAAAPEVPTRSTMAGEAPPEVGEHAAGPPVAVKPQGTLAPQALRSNNAAVSPIEQARAATGMGASGQALSNRGVRDQRRLPPTAAAPSWRMWGWNLAWKKVDRGH